MQFQLWELCWLKKGYSPPAPGVPTAPGSIVAAWMSLADPQVPLRHQGHIQAHTAASMGLQSLQQRAQAVGRGRWRERGQGVPGKRTPAIHNRGSLTGRTKRTWDSGMLASYTGRSGNKYSLYS